MLAVLNADKENVDFYGLRALAMSLFTLYVADAGFHRVTSENIDDIVLMKAVSQLHWNAAWNWLPLLIMVKCFPRV